MSNWKQSINPPALNLILNNLQTIINIGDDQMTKDEHQAYMRNYFKTRCKRINIVLNVEKDADLIKALEGKNIQATTKELMRRGLTESAVDVI